MARLLASPKPLLGKQVGYTSQGRTLLTLSDVATPFSPCVRRFQTLPGWVVAVLGLLISGGAFALDASPGRPQTPLGTPLRVGNLVVHPPFGFRLEGTGAFQHSQLPWITGTEPVLSTRGMAVLLNGRNEEAGAMWVALLEGLVSGTPRGRDAFVRQAVAHFREHLGLTFQVERADWTDTGVPRIDVHGTVSSSGRERRIWLAALDGGDRHAVILFSLPKVPAEREGALLAQVRESLQSARFQGEPAFPLFYRILGWTLAGVTLIGSLMLVRTLPRKRTPSS